MPVLFCYACGGRGCESCKAMASENLRKIHLHAEAQAFVEARCMETNNRGDVFYAHPANMHEVVCLIALAFEQARTVKKPDLVSDSCLNEHRLDFVEFDTVRREEDLELSLT